MLYLCQYIQYAKAVEQTCNTEVLGCDLNPQPVFLIYCVFIFYFIK
jgi:hypothetical protein